jgi:uncharacterized protein (TIGR00290 family)
MPTPIVLAFSGGKDSTLALAALRADPAWQVVGLLTSVTPAYDRVSIHGIRRSILHAQGEALGLPVFEAALEAGADNTAYEAAWTAAWLAAQHALGPVRHLAYGDLFLEDVRAYREALAHTMGATPVFPLWGQDTAALAQRVAADYEAYLTCVDTTQLDATFAGRRYDAALLAALPVGVDPCGERGEFHTCVVGGPGFAARIPVQVGARVRRDDRFEFADLVMG